MRLTRLPWVALALGCTHPVPSTTPPVVPVSERDASPPPTTAQAPARDASAPPSPQDVARDAVFAGLRRYLEGLGGPPRQWPLTLVAGPWSVRERGFAMPFAAALVSSPALGPDATGSITWLVSAAPGSPEVPARLTELGDREHRRDVAEVLVRDVNGDGSDELVVVSRAAGAPGPAADPLVTVHTVDTSLGPRWERLLVVEWQIDGSRDAASVDAALASRGRDEAPAEGTSPERFIARLSAATPAGFRAAIDARGLQVCESAQRGRPSRCRSTPAARLDDAGVVALQRRYFALCERTGTDPPGFSLERCRRGPDATTCSAGEYTGNASRGWTISGAGATMRLARVSE